jgi:cytoskeletal protein RodZ
MAIDYRTWAQNMQKLASCNTFGKRMYWKRVEKSITLIELSLATAIPVGHLFHIERDDEPQNVLDMNVSSYISLEQAKERIEKALNT